MPPPGFFSCFRLNKKRKKWNLSLRGFQKIGALWLREQSSSLFKSLASVYWSKLKLSTNNRNTNGAHSQSKQKEKRKTCDKFETNRNRTPGSSRWPRCWSRRTWARWSRSWTTSCPRNNDQNQDLKSSKRIWLKLKFKKILNGLKNFFTSLSLNLLTVSKDLRLPDSWRKKWPR